MDDRERLATYVEVWWQAVADLLTLLESLPEEAWSRPTDLPGWDVRAVAAHIAHLEAVLAGAPEETADVGEPDHVRGALGRYTEIGVVNRRHSTPASILAEIRQATAARHAALLADPPVDGSARPPRTFGDLPWTWEVLLRNRPLDVWMHEQDVRRAVGRPGGLDSRAGDHTVAQLTGSLGFVLGKRAGAPPGTTLVLDLAGGESVGFMVDGAGRGGRLPEVPPEPMVTLRMHREALVRLAGGRGAPAAGSVLVRGDQELGARVLAAMATMP